MPVAIGFIALIALGGTYLLARHVAADGGPRTGLWAGLLVVIVVAVSFAAQIVSIYYRPPIGWLIALALAAVGAVALFIRIGRDVQWRGSRVAAVVGMLVVADITLVLAMIALPFGSMLVPLFEASAQQMAEADGFDILLAPDETMFTEYKPITKLDADAGGGVQVQYEHFTLLERKADGPLDHTALGRVLASGVDPLVTGGPRITDDAAYTETTVDGRPALGVEYADRNAVEKQGMAHESVRVLAFERDGVEVRIFSHGWQRFDPDTGAYTQVDALSFDELLRIAASLARGE